jgi:glc operon protein GlcG
MPFDILERAMQAAAEAKKHNRKLAISVVDPNGDLVLFQKMDGTQVASVGKARTAARYRRETRTFFNAMETGHPYIATLDPTLVASPGGFPLMDGGKLNGAIGCSGGTGDQDAAICKVGAELIK